MGTQTYKRVVDLLNQEIPAKISRNEFSRITGINRNSIDRYKAGLGTPIFETLEKLAEYFHVSAEWLKGDRQEHTFEQEVLFESVWKSRRESQSSYDDLVRKHGSDSVEIMFTVERLESIERQTLLLSLERYLESTGRSIYSGIAQDEERKAFMETFKPRPLKIIVDDDLATKNELPSE